MLTITCSNIKYQMANSNINFSSDIFNYSLLSGTIFEDYTDIDLRDVSDFTYPLADYELATGNGYTQGGQQLFGGIVTFATPYTYIKFNNVTWSSSTIDAVGGVIWKPSDYSVVQIHNFNSGAIVSSSNGNFLVAFDSNGIIRVN